MKSKHAHPNDLGVWTLLDHDDRAALWRRERADPAPVTMFYVVCPPRQTEIIYSEERAREVFGNCTRLAGATEIASRGA